MTSPVVGLLIYEPVAVHHVAGVEVGHAETVHEVGAVLLQLHHLTSHVKVLVQPHPVAATVLQRARRSKVTTIVKYSFLIYHTCLYGANESTVSI